MLENIFFSVRVVGAWNNLTEDTVSSPSCDSFKNSVQRYFVEDAICNMFRQKTFLKVYWF